jgi:hypothetical protein
MRSDAAPAIDLTFTPTWTGLHTFSGGFLSTLPGGAWGSGALASGNSPINQNATFTGTTTSASANFGMFLTQTDDSSDTACSAGFCTGMGDWLQIGANSVGGRTAGFFKLDLNAATSNSGVQNYTALSSSCNLRATDAFPSSCFGSNPQSHLKTNVVSKSVIGEEVDTWTETSLSVTVASVAITGTAGQFSCTCVGLVVGQQIVISGTYGGTGSITGYTDPTSYFVTATNGTSTFTLQNEAQQAIVTTAGTPTGLTYTASEIRDRVGFQVVDVTGSTYGQQGARDDDAIAITNQYAPSTGLGYKTGLTFGRYGGNAPVATDGTLIGGQGNQGAGFTVANGIDWSKGTFTGYELNFGNFSVDGSGNEKNNSVVVGSPTGGNKGAGTVNATGLYVNGTAVGGSLPSSAAYTLIGNNTASTATAAAFGSGVGAVFDIRTYGAACDGVTDDHAAWQSAITAIEALTPPTGALAPISATLKGCQSGKSLVTTSLNFTGLTSFGTPTALDVTVDMTGSCLVGQTSGTPVIDALGARYISWEHLCIYGSGTNTPNIGLQIGRANGAHSADVHHFNRPVIEGNFTFTALYNEGSEDNLFIDPVIWNGSAPGTVTGVAITGTAGQISCTCAGLAVGNTLVVSGTLGGTGTITGYTNPTTYIVSAVGSGTATLQPTAGGALTTTAGTPTGLTYTPEAYALVLDGYNHWNVQSAFATVTGNPVDTNSSFGNNVFIGGWISGNSSNVIPIWIANASWHQFIGGYATTTAANCVVLYTEATGNINNLNADLHCETSAMTDEYLVSGPATAPAFTNLKIHDRFYPGSNSILKLDTGVTSASIQGGEIKIPVFSAGNGIKVFDSPSAWTFSGQVYVPNSGNWSAAPASFSGSLCVLNTCDNYKQPYSLQNTAAGNTSANAVTTALNITAFGYYAASLDSTGNKVACFGASACQDDTTGEIAAFGFDAGQFVSTGLSNTALGNFALLGVIGAKTTGANNTAVGDSTLIAVQGAGNANTAVGQSAGATITTGATNTIVGNAVLSATLTTGSSNTYIGNSASCTSSAIAAGTSNTLGICAGSTPIISATGGGTPGTSVTTIAGLFGGGGAAPTVASGFGSTPSIGTGSIPSSFSVNVGTGGSATTGVITLPTATNAWSCYASDTGTTPTGQTEPSAMTTTSVTLTNYSRTTGLAVAWTASEIVQASCFAH